MYYVYNGFYVFDFIAHCWATFSALRALLSSHVMTNKDNDDDDINRKSYVGFRLQQKSSVLCILWPNVWQLL